MTAAPIHALAFCLLALTLVLAGDQGLPESMGRVCPWARLATAFSLGLAFSAAAFLLGAAAGVLSVRYVWGVQGVITLGALTRTAALLKARRLRHAGSPGAQRSRMDRVARLSLIPVILIALATFLTTLAPPSSMDAMVYHLRMPAVYLAEGRWVVQLDVVQSFQPAYVEMAFGHAMALGGDVVGALIHWGLGIGLAVSAGAWARRFGASPWLAALLVLGTPLFVWESTGAFIDLGLALFGSLAVYWASTEETGWSGVVVAGVLAGLAAGSKLTGGALAALAGGAAFATAWPRWRLGLVRLLVIGSIALVIASPWYLHNLAVTGNPFYPVGNAFFGVPERPFAGDYYGYGRRIFNLLSSPFDLVWRGAPFDQGWSVGPTFLGLVPLGAFAARQTSTGRVLLACIAVFWVFWFYSMPQTRLLLPIFPFGAALVAAGVKGTLEGRSRSLRAAVLGMVSLSTLVGLAVALAFARTYVPAALGIESQDLFLTRMSWHYPAYAAANARLPSDARVAVSGANNLYYLRRRSTIVEEGTTAAQLREGGFTHLLAITDCDKPRPPAALLWSGRYPLPVSRLKGGVGATVCASLHAL